MNLPTPPTRAGMLNFFRYIFRMYPPGPELAEVRLPRFMNEVVNELVCSKGCPGEAALLGQLAVYAAADAGRTHIVTSDGYRNSLGLLMYAGFESGVGKTLAMEEALAFFAEREREAFAEVTKANDEIRFQNSLHDARIKRLLKEYGKSCSEDIAAEIRVVKDKVRPLHRYHPFLLGDITPAAYTQNLVETGTAIRLESDGILLPPGVLRQVTKGWAGEGTNRTRLTMPDGQVDDPFILDFVMTQPGTFHKYINEFANNDSGMLARMLIYKYDHGNTRRQGIIPRPMREEVRWALREKLMELYTASQKARETGRCEHRLVPVSPEAEQILDRAKMQWDATMVYGGPCYRIREFVKRMPQHAIRLAGCLYLSEFSAESKTPVPGYLMESAIHLVEVFGAQMLRWSIKDYEDVNAECCRAVMIFVLEKNFAVVPETLLKQAIKHKFSAADVSVALEFLLAEGHLIDAASTPFLQNEVRKRGRPSGRDLRNPYYDPNGYSF